MNGSLADTLAVFPVVELEYQPQYPCQVGVLDLDLDKVPVGLVYPKNWPYKHLFDHYLSAMGSAGLLKRIKSNYQRRDQGCGKAATVATEFSDVVSICTIPVLGSIFAMAILLLESWSAINRHMQARGRRS